MHARRRRGGGGADAGRSSRLLASCTAQRCTPYGSRRTKGPYHLELMRLAALATAAAAAASSPIASAQTTAMTFMATPGSLCQQKDIPDGTKCNNHNDEDKCWSYWSDTDTLDQCKYQCQQHTCSCFGYKPDDTGYFHKCRMLLPGKWAGKTAHSSVGFTAYVPDHDWPPALDRPSSWLGWAIVLAAVLYAGCGTLFGLASGRPGRGGIVRAHPHHKLFFEVAALTRDGLAFCARRRVGVAGARLRTGLTAAEQSPKKRGSKSKKPNSSKSSNTEKAGKGKRSSPQDGGKIAPELSDNERKTHEKTAPERDGTQLLEHRDGAVHSSQQRLKVVALSSAPNA